MPYYWSVESAEYATDIAFHSAEELQRWYPLFVRHACETLQGSDVLRFLGYRVRQDGRPRKDLVGEVTTHVNELVEGTRVKHQAVNNLLKMYDKFGVVLRVETLVRDVRHFKVYRTKENNPDGPLQNLRMRKGVADLHQRAEVSRKITVRYTESLATIEAKQPLRALQDDLGRAAKPGGAGPRERWRSCGRRGCGFAPEAVSRGEFQIAGFYGNSDIRVRLFGETTDAAEQRRQSAKVTRLLQLLRAHGLIAQAAPRQTVTKCPTMDGMPISAILAARKLTPSGYSKPHRRLGKSARRAKNSSVQ